MKNDAPKLGQIIEGEAFRDAIHIAVTPILSGSKCYPGDHVGLLPDGRVSVKATPAIGIIDPYLPAQAIHEGEKVWLLMFPNTITGLRHEWTHPAFEAAQQTFTPPKTEKEKSEEWLRNCAEDCGTSYERMMGALEADDYISTGENEDFRDVDEAEFEKHVKIVTGKENAYPPFSCSC